MAAISPDLGCAPVDNAIRDVFQAHTNTFRSVFADVQDCAPDFTGVHEVFEILRGINFVAAHRERLETHRDPLGPNMIDNTERWLKYWRAAVSRALAQQTLIDRGYTEFFDDLDVLICPAAAVLPFPHAQLAVETINGDKMPTYMRWLALSCALTTALPAVACIPCGVDRLACRSAFRSPARTVLMHSCSRSPTHSSRSLPWTRQRGARFRGLGKLAG